MAEFTTIELNGAPAQLDDLRHLVQTNYGHFTAMRVRDGGVRGLALHLDRLQHATRELFGAAIDPDRVRRHVRHALGGRDGELSVRVNVYSRELSREHLNRPVAVDVLVMVGAASPSVLTPLRVKSFRYAREAPSIKHVGTFSLFDYRRRAQIDGFDDAVFVDQEGRLSEGSIWNIGFADEDGIVWPESPQLAGIGMQVLQAGLARQGIPSSTTTIRLQDLARYRSAFFTNASIPVRPIASIDGCPYEIDEALFARLRACYDGEPVSAI